MLEAGVPSTGSRNTPGSGVVPATLGAVMVAPPEAPRNVQTGKAKGRSFLSENWLRPYECPRCDEHEKVTEAHPYGVPAPPGALMVALPEPSRF